MIRAVALCVVCALSLAAASAGHAQTPRRLSFADAVTQAAQTNLQLRAAVFEVAVADAQLAQARGGQAPQVNVTGSVSRIQERPGQTITIPVPPGPPIVVTLPGPDPTQVALRLSAQYPLYTGGRVEAQIALAEANVRGARAVLARTQQQVVFQVQQAYLLALLAQERIAAANRALEQANESLRVAQARVRAGASPQFDVLQAEVAVANAQADVARAQVAARNAQQALAAAIGLPIDQPLELTDALEPRAVPAALPGVLERALRERPELAEIQARQAAARAGVDLAISGARPTWSLAGNYDVSGGANAISGAWSLTLAMTLNLYDGGITRERVREAELRVEQLRVLEAQQRQRIELDVRQAWNALEQSTTEMAAASAAVTAAREAARIARVRFEAGVGTSLELLQAQAQLAAAELSLAQARFNQNQARIQLMLAAGGSL
jgi:outer membrane protein TolC